MVCLYRCPTNSFFMEAGNMAIMSLSSYIAFSDHSVLKKAMTRRRILFGTDLAFCSKISTV
jgi:hypothetical protein